VTYRNYGEIVGALGEPTRAELGPGPDLAQALRLEFVCGCTFRRAFGALHVSVTWCGKNHFGVRG
jgi:hypothetical protein